LRRASWEATTPKQRERLRVRAERLAAKDQVQQVRFQERRRRLIAHRRTWQQKLEARQGKREKVAQALQELDEDRLFYDFDLEKDDLMTYLRMARENAQRFVQEQYFTSIFLGRVDEATMVRVVYSQPGWIRRQGQYLHVLLQGYSDPELQAAVVQACQRVNQVQVELPSGHQLHVEVAARF